MQTHCKERGKEQTALLPPTPSVADALWFAQNHLLLTNAGGLGRLGGNVVGKVERLVKVVPFFQGQKRSQSEKLLRGCSVFQKIPPPEFEKWCYPASKAPSAWKLLSSH
ncbi:Hypothetical predicted protein [Podarcis lilfordi]|uniref:Uncharacterized protein n=1 Tax=Podarcis lilfordi TaxID=74358 RepID=A0AA35LKA2_9SAUR|nr:Hypothetical predicted protein [Podarcis lilfordi]